MRQTARAGFRAMSTAIEVIGVDVSQSAVEAAARFGARFAEAWERSFSRFRADSELSRLNAAQGRPLNVSVDFIAVLALAVAASERTGGRFDPTILPALEAAGYDRDIAEVRRRAGCLTAPSFDRAGPVAPIEIDRDRQQVRLPVGLRLDLGGIAKGAFVDRLAAELADWPGGSVDAGGDLRFWGVPPSGRWWIVAIEDPAQPDADRVVAEVRRPAGAAATSGTYRRRWQLDGAEAHHLIDPLTLRPLAGGVRAATAFSTTTVEAEAATKALMVAASRGEPLDPFGCWVAVAIDDGDDAAFIAGYDEDACTFYSDRFPHTA
jgi:thiamine biosynthesis lipoprotein